MSLKQTLNDLIKSRKGQIVSLQEVDFICKRDSFKLSNAERRLRASESPNVASYKKDGAIIGYYWRPVNLGEGMTADQFMEKFAKPVEVKKITNTLF